MDSEIQVLGYGISLILLNVVTVLINYLQFHEVPDYLFVSLNRYGHFAFTTICNLF